MLLPHCRFCSEIILTIGLQVTSFSSHFLHVIPKNFPLCCCGHFGHVCVCAGALWDSLVGIGFGALDVRIRAVKIRLSQSNWQNLVQAQIQLV